MVALINLRRLFPVFLLFALAGFCSASYIQMTIILSSTEVVVANNFPLKFTLLNTGDEPAYDVQASLVLPEGFSTEPVYAGILQPNITFHGSFNVRVTDSVKPGTYSIFLKTHYTDANAYPFTTLSSAFIRYKKPTPILLRGELEDLKIMGEEKKDLKLKISNLDNRKHTVLVKLHLPDELNADYYSTEVDVDARGVGVVSVPLKSFGALPGSTYMVFTSMEYDMLGSHYASTSYGTVSIIAQKEPDLPSWLPLATIIVMALALVYYQIKK